MNYKMVGFVLGRIFWIEAVLMLCPMACSALYGEWNIVLAFLWPALGLTLLGRSAGPAAAPQHDDLRRDGLVIVALVWVLMSVFGGAALHDLRRDPFFLRCFF